MKIVSIHGVLETLSSIVLGNPDISWKDRFTSASTPNWALDGTGEAWKRCHVQGRGCWKVIGDHRHIILSTDHENLEGHRPLKGLLTVGHQTWNVLERPCRRLAGTSWSWSQGASTPLPQEEPVVPHLERINPRSQQKIPLGFRISCAVKFLVASSEH